jgi:hypothetical protein
MADEKKEPVSFFNVKTKEKEETDEWTEHELHTKHGNRRVAEATGRDGTRMVRFLPSKRRA